MGSFYHVVGFRLPKGESIWKPKHSYCPDCNHKLGISELVPIFSYLWQRGKCKNCKKKISLFYPLLELATGILFAVSFYSFGWSWNLGIALALSSLFVIVIVSDIEYLMIPDEVTFSCITIIAFLILLSQDWTTFLASLGSGTLLFAMMYFIMQMGDFLFKKESLGGADVKLMFLVGLVVPPIVGCFVLFVASATALLASLFVFWKERERVIPFGPFIMASLLLFYFLKIDLNVVNHLLQLW